MSKNLIAETLLFDAARRYIDAANSASTFNEWLQAEKELLEAAKRIEDDDDRPIARAVSQFARKRMAYYDNPKAPPILRKQMRLCKETSELMDAICLIDEQNEIARMNLENPRFHSSLSPQTSSTPNKEKGDNHADSE